MIPITTIARNPGFVSRRGQLLMPPEAEKTSSELQPRRARRTKDAATPAPAGRSRRGRAVKEAEETAVVPVGKGRATPSRRQAEEEEEKERGGNFITRFVYGMREYFQGVSSEVRKVNWPSREDTRRLSVIVVGVLIVMSIALGAISALFTEMFRLGLRSPIILIVFMVVAVGAGLFIARRSGAS
jgi:preprotein translocase subunit SecE